MQAVPSPALLSEAAPDTPLVTTLLELVTAVADSARSDQEVVAVVMDLLRSGRVTLVGNFLVADL